MLFSFCYMMHYNDKLKEQGTAKGKGGDNRGLWKAVIIIYVLHCMLLLLHRS